MNNMDFNFATKKAATKRIKQAVAEPIMARLNSFRPDSTRSPRSEMEQRRMSQTGTRRVWVITCKGGHEEEEEITQFDGGTVKKMMTNEISTFLSNVNNVKIPPEGFNSEVTRTVSRARMRFRTHH